jgi:hypothetical protein
MRQETLLVVGLIVALTIAYSSAFEASRESTPLEVAESPGERAPGFTGIRHVSALAVITGSESH